ncbi:putative glycerophosphoryl diester phosphodiesterase [Agrobacterium sp. ATCC 31749]|nr:putative glycerophosphoryl diester phosphodiesterase [Agrobacterium sp. ATCC 31749]
MLARHAIAVCSAIQGPIVKYRKFAVRGRMYVELDGVRAGLEAGFHGSDCVLDENVT